MLLSRQRGCRHDAPPTTCAPPGRAEGEPPSPRPPGTSPPSSLDRARSRFCSAASSVADPTRRLARPGSLSGRRTLRVQVVAWCRPRGLQHAPLSSCTVLRWSPLVDAVSQSVIPIAVLQHHQHQHHNHHPQYSRELYHQKRERKKHRCFSPVLHKTKKQAKLSEFQSHQGLCSFSA